MPYLYINKESNESRLFGSLPVMCRFTGLEKSKLEYQFSRLKKREFETEKYKILKLELERAQRQKKI